MFNLNNLRPKSLRRLLDDIGIDAVDGAEFHGKWPAGGVGQNASLDDWMREVPLENHKYGYTYRGNTRATSRFSGPAQNAVILIAVFQCVSFL